MWKIFKFKLCSPACQSIVLISYKIFIMAQKFFLLLSQYSETVLSSDVVRSLLQDLKNFSRNVSNSEGQIRGLKGCGCRSLGAPTQTRYFLQSLGRSDWPPHPFFPSSCRWGALLPTVLFPLCSRALQCCGAALVAPPHMHFLSACGGPRGSTAQGYYLLTIYIIF